MTRESIQTAVYAATLSRKGERAALVECALQCFEDNPCGTDDSSAEGILRFLTAAGETVRGRPVEMHDVMEGLFRLRIERRVFTIEDGASARYRLRRRG